MSEPTESSDSWAGIGWRHPHYRELLEQKPPLAFIEVHSENFFGQGGAALALLEQARSSYPVSLHGVGLSLGSAVGIDPWHLEQLQALVQRIEPVRVSDHASFARGTFNNATVHAGDLLPIPFSTDALDVLCNNVNQVQEKLKRRFMVENLSAYLTWQSQSDAMDLSEPDFLGRLCGRTGCALLVDVNNIYVNALNAQLRGLSGDPLQHCRYWLDAISPDCVGEVHLAGHCLADDEHGRVVVDDHGSEVCESVWTLYQHALSRFGPVPTLIEWDTHLPAFEVLIHQAQRADGYARSPSHSNKHKRSKTTGAQSLTT
jgi:uncharacterized protein